MLNITSKQRAFLRSMCNTMDVTLFIGKEGLEEHILKEADIQLEARELIKCAIQRGADTGNVPAEMLSHLQQRAVLSPLL